MLSATLKVSIQESNSPPNLSKTPFTNLVLSSCKQLLLLYDCHKTFINLVSQYPSLTEILAVESMLLEGDLLVAVANAQSIEIISISYSKVLYLIPLDQGLDGLVGMVWVGSFLGVVLQNFIDFYDLETKRKVNTVSVEQGSITCFCKGNGKEGSIVLGTSDGRVLLLNENLALDDIFHTVDENLNSMQVLDDYLAIFNTPGCLTLWRLSSGTKLSVINSYGSASFGMWTFPASGLIQIGFGRLNGDVHVYHQLLPLENERGNDADIKFNNHITISHKKSTKAIRSLYFVDGNLIFSGDDSIVWSYSLDVLED
jgi:hypothetical protein